MKYTKQLKIVNVFNEEVTVEPISYSIATETLEAMEDGAKVLEQLMQLLRHSIENNIENITDTKEFKQLKKLQDDLEEKENNLREKYNYYYCGLDNLEPADKEFYLKKYPRRNTN